ncbi:MAG TPA: tetratricopeptide repeat protein [Anaerolineae bacterium]|nr:tetratricopeptide repeat protein [Anaerolineae bacterium]HOR00347.1 tetratricopeptide repeat protein [Anaerolineae bacterium]HPL26929.1 tetratricopeptide repeat protein [Anaerolineae bacterium]
MIDNWHRGEAGFFFERGEALEQAGRLDEAMSEFKRAIHADPGLAEAHMALGYHYRRKNLLSKAAEEFRTATSLAPSYDSLFNLGHVLVDLGQPREALAAFRQCLALAPGNAAVGYEIAYALYVAGDHAAALEELQPLLAAAADDWELRYLTGSCELALGRYAAAQASLERALALLPAGEPDDGLREALQVALRYREFGRVDPDDVKAHLYAEYGVVCLGALGDDGLHLAVEPRDRLTFQDLGRMLQRFHALRLHWRWRFDAVVAVDEASRPLAVALSHSLRVPIVEPDEAPLEGLTLLVWATVTMPELLDVVIEHVHGDYVTFVAAPDRAALDNVIADIVGVVTGDIVTLPWETPTRRRTATAAAREILAAVKSLPPDATLPAQVRYYAGRHRRLRFLQ